MAEWFEPATSWVRNSRRSANLFTFVNAHRPNGTINDS